MNRKKLLLTLSMILGLNSTPLMAELTQLQLNATLGIVTNFILDDGITHHGTSYGTVTSPYTGRVWLDRNLGASQVCTSFDDPLCYGDYYQWGRNFDGHQDSGSATTTTLATDVNNVGHGNLILGSGDWASVDSNKSIRSANWSKTDGSSVCPVGFRVPSITELRAETLDNGVTNRNTAFTNFLKLPSAGIRDTLHTNGMVLYVFSTVWAISPTSIPIMNYLLFEATSAATTGSYNTTAASSVRCIKN